MVTAALIVGQAAPASAASSRPSFPSPQELLAELKVAPERGAGYDRDLYPHWVDADGDGCDTRREVIISESLTPPSVSGDCWIDGGHWVSRYDAVAIHGYPARFDVDHLVPLKEAHDSGAYAWSAAKRLEFANDLASPEALILVTASSNRSKSDKDPGQWLPVRRETHCGYASDWVRVKHKWGLNVDPAEKRALARILSRCPQGSTLVRPAR